jgi:hypothetical protein
MDTRITLSEMLTQRSSVRKVAYRKHDVHLEVF